MHFSTILATSALAATAFAAPNAQGRPWGYQPPRRPTTKATQKSTTSTKTSLTSGVIVDPTQGSACSTATVTSVGIATFTVTEAGETSIETSIVTDVATITETAEGETSTVTVVQTGAAGVNYTLPGATYTVTEIVDAEPTACPTSNSTAPFPTSTPDVPSVPCVNDEDAEQLAEVFRMLIQNYTSELAMNALTEDFIDYSSAVNIIMNKGAQYPKDITGPTFATRAAFMAGQGSQPKIPFERLNTFHGCDSVSVRWKTVRSANGQAREVAAIPVVGNGLMYVVPAEENNAGGFRFRIKDLYSEFNAAAWLVNLGVFKPNGTVDYINQNVTVAKRSMHFDFDESMRGAMI